jgi:hypothetical protein
MFIYCKGLEHCVSVAAYTVPSAYSNDSTSTVSFFIVVTGVGNSVKIQFLQYIPTVVTNNIIFYRTKLVWMGVYKTTILSYILYCEPIINY